MYEDWNEEDYLEEEEYPASRAAERRKNDWKIAERGRRILRNKIQDRGYITKSSPDEDIFKKPLHYYSKTKPELYYQRTNKTNNKGKHRTAYGNYNPAKNWSIADKRKLQNGENQLEELFDEE